MRLESFMARVRKSDSSGCWDWTGQFFKSGYPCVKVWAAGKTNSVKGNRHAWRLFRGEPGKGHVLHHCDNKACVNPDHLYLGTHQQNMADSKLRGTHASGQRSGKFKRFDGTIDRIRDLRTHGYGPKEIMAYLGLGHSTYYGWKLAGLL